MRTHHILCYCLLLLIGCKKEADQTGPIAPENGDHLLKNYNKDLTIVNWNIEWFGDASGFSKNLNDQEANAAKVIKYLDADLYGFCEIVDTTRFGRMIRNTLGPEFNYAVSFFTSGRQKLAYAYNKNIFRNVAVRPFMGVSAPAYYNFGNRYPFMLTADVAVNGTKKSVHFILIHAKANADPDSYNKRVAAAQETKDSLDVYYKDKYFMLFGDYNDNFDKSILAGKESPYQIFLNDSPGYYPVTAPLNVTGSQSTLGYANSVIDQQIISSPMQKWYITSSARIRTDVVNVVKNYASGNTSDHYPITSVYKIKP